MGIARNRLTILVARVIVNKSKNGILGGFAHVAASLANNLLKGLHHGILDSHIFCLRSRDEFWYMC